MTTQPKFQSAAEYFANKKGVEPETLLDQIREAKPDTTDEDSEHDDWFDSKLYRNGWSPFYAELHTGAWWYVNEKGNITFSYDLDSLLAWRGGDNSRFGPGSDCYDADSDGAALTTSASGKWRYFDTDDGCGEIFETEKELRTPTFVDPEAEIYSAGCARRYAGTTGCNCPQGACWVTYARDHQAKKMRILTPESWKAGGYPMPKKE